MAAEGTKATKWFSFTVFISALLAVVFILVMLKVTGMGMDSKPKGLTQSQYDSLSAENKPKYQFDAASGLYIAK